MDNDEIRQTIVQPWRKPARLATSKSPIEQVARAAERSLHKTLTAEGVGGCPGLLEIIEPLQRLCREYRRGPLLYSVPEVQAEARQQLVAQLQDIQEQHDLHKHTILAADVARAICVEIGHRKANYDNKTVALRVARGFCRRIVEHYLFAQLRPILRRELSLSYTEADTWEEQVLEAMSPFIDTTAARLLQDATGSKVKRPVRRSAIKSATVDLLGVNLL